MDNTPDEMAQKPAQPIGAVSGQGQRQSAIGVLNYRMQHSVANLQKLEVIKKMLPAEPTPEQDDALWWLFANVNLS